MKIKKVIKRITSVFLLATLISTNAYATESTGSANEIIDGTKEEGTIEELVEKGKALKVQSNEWKDWVKGPETSGRSAIVMEAKTGAILYAKNIDEKEYPASITKLLTTVLAFEKGDLEKEVTVSDNAINCMLPGYAHVGLKPGNKINLKDALYATLIASANEAAYVVGESVAQENNEDYNWFIEQMNEKCQEIGALNSHFVNTNGIPDPNHYTTARDMALIARELYQYPEFFQMSTASSYIIPATPNLEEINLWQKNKILIPGAEQYYEWAIGGKTGYTEEARSTLVTMAKKDDLDLICVVLHTYGSNSYNDTKALFDYGFTNFKKYDIASFIKEKDLENYHLEKNLGFCVLPKSFDTKKLTYKITPNKLNNKEGTLNVYYGKNLVGSAKVETQGNVVTDKAANNQGETKTNADLKEKGVNSFLLPIGALGLLFILVLAFLLLVIKRNRKSKRKKRRKRRRR